MAPYPPTDRDYENLFMWLFIIGALVFGWYTKDTPECTIRPCEGFIVEYTK